MKYLKTYTEADVQRQATASYWSVVGRTAKSYRMNPRTGKVECYGFRREGLVGFDMRRRFCQDVYRVVAKRLQDHATFRNDCEMVCRKRHERAHNPHNRPVAGGNILSNGLLKDWLKIKKFNTTRVYSDGIADGWRNHHARTPEDFKVLAVIKKYYDQGADNRPN